MDIKQIQKELQFHNIEGWLLYDLHNINNIATTILEIPNGIMITRRCFYWIPQKGIPVKIVHKVESQNLDHLPGKKHIYLSWRELHTALEDLLSEVKQVAMEYSPYQAIPTVSKVDAGLIDLIRGFGVNIVSSAVFLQNLICTWSNEQYLLHKEAAKVLEVAVEGAWNLIRRSLKDNKIVTEYDVQQLILSTFKENNCITEGVPICGVNSNTADPHYCPKKNQSQIINKGDFILIDLWCKRNLSQGVFADITRVGVADSKPTSQQQEIFSLIRKAQKTGTALIIKRYQKGQEIKGEEVDAAVRQVIKKGGYDAYFTHRTGHNINIDNHGPGANLDGLETQDSRPLIPRTCFSIEPGVYLPGKFGIRLEYDVYIHPDHRVEITVSPQEEIVILD